MSLLDPGPGRVCVAPPEMVTWAEPSSGVAVTVMSVAEAGRLTEYWIVVGEKAGDKDPGVTPKLDSRTSGPSEIEAVSPQP